MTTNRRAAHRLAHQRRRMASGRRPEALQVSLQRLPERPRPPRPPIVLRIAIRRDIPPAVQAIFEAAARQIEDLARVRFVPMADLPDGVPFGVQLPGDETHPLRGRWARAAVAFASAWEDTALEDPAVEALVDAWMAGGDRPELRPGRHTRAWPS